MEPRFPRVLILLGVLGAATETGANDWTPAGDDPSRHVVEAKRRDLCFDLRGKFHITLDGLGLFAGGIETDERSAGILLDGIEARYVGHALWYPGWWSLATPFAINLRGPDSEIRHSTVGYAAGHAVFLQGPRSRAVNNVIHDPHAPTDGKEYFGNGAIYLEGRCRNFVIHHNVMWNIAGPGIYLPGMEGEFSGIQVFNNTSDAPFNVLKPAGVTLKNNVFWAFQFDRVPPGDLGTNVTFRKQHPTVPFLKDPGFENPAKFDFRPRPGSPLVDRGVAVPPWTDGFAGRAPDAGALEHGRPPFTAGAVVAERHLPQLRLSYSGPASSSTVFTILNVPADRKLPPDFKLKIGGNEPGGEVSYVDGVWTVRGVPCRGAPSSQAVAAVIGAGKPVVLPRAPLPPARP